MGGAAPRAGDWAAAIHEHQETMGTGDRINALGLKIAKYIEDQFGYYGLFVPPGVNKGQPAVPERRARRRALGLRLAQPGRSGAASRVRVPLLLGHRHHAAVPGRRTAGGAGLPGAACVDDVEGARHHALPRRLSDPEQRSAWAARSSRAASRTASTTPRAARRASTPTGFPASRRRSRPPSTRPIRRSGR